MKLIKGDIVQIIAGKDKGKQGKIMKVDPKNGKILVEGINMIKKHRKSKKQGEKGETVSLPRFFDISNAMIFCPSCSRPARVGYKKENDRKVRYCKKCKAPIEK